MAESENVFVNKIWRSGARMCQMLCTLFTGYHKLFLLSLLLVVLYMFLSFPGTYPNTLYKHYNIASGHNQGLTVTTSRMFLLNGKPITLTSGFIHYCRVHPHYWRDRLRKLRAAGAIAVKTAVPWNLHEPFEDVYDFGDANTEMSAFLDIIKFVQIAQQEDLLVIIAIGPYINAQIDLGGLPSYLLGKGLKVRTSDPKFMNRVEKFFSKLLPLLKPLQIQEGGPIISFQIENSYGTVKAPEIDEQYMISLKKLVEQNGIVGLLITCDPVSATLDRGALSHHGVLQTVNSETDALAQLETLEALHPQSPAFIHLRTGSVDHWNRPTHNVLIAHEYEETLREILEFQASVCLYVFHGGTNFQFLSGATSEDMPSSFHPHTTSFDFDAPLTEAGDYTPKYWLTLELFRAVHSHLHHPPPPPPSRHTLELTIPLSQELPWPQIVQQSTEQIRGALNFIHLEDLPPIDGRKQSHGYVKYSFQFRSVKRTAKMKLLGSRGDIVMVLVDGARVNLKQIGETNQFGYWDSDSEVLNLDMAKGLHTMDLLVEACARVSQAHSLQWLTTKKGLGPQVRVLFQLAAPVGRINITGMPFRSDWINSLRGWKERVHYETKPAPSLVKAVFYLAADQISDTFLEIGEWQKGLVFVNGFNIGRYFCGSPQQTLYIPAPLLRVGENTIIMFEHYYNSYFIKLTNKPVFL